MANFKSKIYDLIVAIRQFLSVILVIQRSSSPNVLSVQSIANNY